ncbi:unnamed protein product [Nezara viridula]|uniref:U11/U12 small nuclear ribonucleoprotein 35 kDa protein n=1 Tax=Nezara viridula TaxID=85310 RepID=A0A9P0MP53_NEZVI|nr:unnamed protein product [Nezara viridula]
MESSFSNTLTEKQRDILEKFWCPSSIFYDPLKAGSIDGTDTEPHDKAVIRAQNSHYKPNCRVKGQPECTVFVSRLDYTTKGHEIKRHFSQYGKIIKCRLVEDIVTGKSKGYAFIEYETEREAARAYRNGHRTFLDGKELFVDMECERLLPGWIPRRLGGGFNGKKESGQIRFGGRDRPFRKPINLLTSKEILNSFDERVKNFK